MLGLVLALGLGLGLVLALALVPAQARGRGQHRLPVLRLDRYYPTELMISSFSLESS